VVYLDYNATAPLHPAARAAWLRVVDGAWHNPSSLFAAGTAARDILEDARERLADRLGCDPERVVFTSGATAANNALARHLARTGPPGARVLISAIEHPSVVEPFHAELAGRVTETPVDRHGVVRLDALETALGGGAGNGVLVSVMAASNESGTLQPWPELAALCRRHGAAFHTDASQWLGKLPAAGLGGCDWVTGSGHKFGGPKGVGFLVVPAGLQTLRTDRGGPQERGRRAGTEDVAAVAALVAALEARDAEPEPLRAARAADRDAAAVRLQARLPEAVVIGAGAPRLWNTLAVLVPGGDGRRLVARLAAAGICGSTGSACSGGAGSTARILAAIGPEALGATAGDLRGLVRLSAGWETTAADWTAAVDALAEAVGAGERSLPRVSLAAPAAAAPPAPGPRP